MSNFSHVFMPVRLYSQYCSMVLEFIPKLHDSY